MTRVAELVMVRDQGPAVLVFSREGRLINATPSAEHRITELGGDLWNDPLSAVTALVAHVGHARRRESVTAREPADSAT